MLHDDRSVNMYRMEDSLHRAEEEQYYQREKSETSNAKASKLTRPFTL
jgi:hypothetical protein